MNSRIVSRIDRRAHRGGASIRNAMRTAALAAGLLACQNSFGALMVDVYGANGAGYSTWSFSGASTAVNPGGSERFGGNNDVTGGNEAWTGFDGSWSDTPISGNLAPNSSTATIDVAGTEANISRIRYGNNVDGTFGVATDAPSDLNLSNGDTVSWSGEMDFYLGVDSFSDFTSSELGGLEIEFNVHILDNLQLTITGAAGSGTTTWTFSGGDTATITGSHEFGGSNEVSGGSEGWNDLGATWSGNAGISPNTQATGGSAFLVVDGVQYDMGTTRYGNTLNGFLGMATDNLSDVSLVAGSGVMWGGSLEFGIDVSQFSSTSSNELAGLDLIVTVIDTSVPAPPASWLVAAGLVLLSSRAGRRRPCG